MSSGSPAPMPGSQSDTRHISTAVRGEGLSLSETMASWARCMFLSSSSRVKAREKAARVLVS